eukprot:11167739-Lingulodinium_polyedra.AAC.1
MDLPGAGVPKHPIAVDLRASVVENIHDRAVRAGARGQRLCLVKECVEPRVANHGRIGIQVHNANEEKK